MDFLQPPTWADALATPEAEHPDAVPIAGGTDVMVELNFDRRRPGGAARPDPGRRAGRRGRSDGELLRSGAGVTYTRVIDELGDRLPGPGHGLAHRRLAADPQPRHGRRQPRLGLARPATPTRRCWPPARWSSWPRCAAPGWSRSTSSSPALKRSALGPRRADRRRLGPAAPRAAAVPQDRHPQRDGDRGLLVRARAAPRPPARSAPASARPRPTPRRARDAEAFLAGELDWRRALGAARPSCRRPRRRVRRAGRARPPSPIDDVRGTAALPPARAGGAGPAHPDLGLEGVPRDAA